VLSIFLKNKSIPGDCFEANQIYNDLFSYATKQIVFLIKLQVFQKQ